MAMEDVTILNFCDGKLVAVFEEMIARVGEDIARRGAACLDKRSITLTLEMTPQESGLISECVFGKACLPAVKYGGVAKSDSRGRIEQLVDGQLDAFDKEKNEKIIHLGEKKEAQQ
jgi:hypothetical protein